MDDLISRKALREAVYHEAFEMDSDMQKWDSGCWIRYKMFENHLKDIPSVPAVPLDKLCEWLNVHCGRPNYCNDRICGECNLDGEGFEYETCWKTLLTEWMEGLDEAD